MPKCISENWSVVKQVGSIETWRCKLCGNEETFCALDPKNEPILPPNREPIFRVVGRWVSKPSAEQVSEIQEAIPVLRDVPVSSLLRKAMQRSDIELGRFNESELRELEPMLRRVGLKITRLPMF